MLPGVVAFRSHGDAPANLLVQVAGRDAIDLKLVQHGAWQYGLTPMGASEVSLRFGEETPLKASALAMSVMPRARVAQTLARSSGSGQLPTARP